MNTARKYEAISVADYLAGEAASAQKHEYVCGEVYAQAGGTNVHNRIATNATIELGNLLRGSHCQVYNSDTKIRICADDGVRFFYPELSVVCESNPDGETFQDNPVVIVEVLSPSTRRQDLGEKREHYCKLPSLKMYVLLEQTSAAAIVFQRVAGDEKKFERLCYVGVDQQIPLRPFDLNLSLRGVYDGIELAE